MHWLSLAAFSAKVLRRAPHFELSLLFVSQQSVELPKNLICKWLKQFKLIQIIEIIEIIEVSEVSEVIEVVEVIETIEIVGVIEMIECSTLYCWTQIFVG